MRDLGLFPDELILCCAEWRRCSLIKRGRAVRVCFLQPCQGVQHYPTAIEHWGHKWNGHTGLLCISFCSHVHFMNLFVDLYVNLNKV